MSTVTVPDARTVLALQAALAGDDPDAGFVWSPLSVASALGLAAAGAAGDTLAELAAVLAPDSPDPAGLRRVTSALAAAARPAPPGEWSAGAEIAVVNTLWARADLPVAPAYAATVRAWPGGTVRAADFRADPAGARRAVNADVARSTRDLVRDLLGPGDVTADTLAVLVNALWLRAGWQPEFPAAATGPAPFDTPHGTVEVPTMRQEGWLPVAEAPGWLAVSLPVGADLAADVLLPDRPLAEAEPALDAGTLAALLASRPEPVALELPRFRVEGAASLREPLAAVGVRTLFTDVADLSGVTVDARPLTVSAAVHKAVLTVDEAGLEGAAATALVMTAGGAAAEPAEPRRVRVDRPFLLLVRHRRSGTVYFLARITDPAPPP